MARRKSRSESLTYIGGSVKGEQIAIGNDNQINVNEPAEVDSLQSLEHQPSLGSHVFLSYSRSDSVEVRQLVAILRATGVVVWLDESHIQVGSDWRQEVRDALERSAAVIAVFSARSEARGWSEHRSELSLAQGIRRQRELPVLPVRLSPCELPCMPIGPRHTLLTDLHHIDLFPDLASSGTRLALQLAAWLHGAPGDNRAAPGGGTQR